MAIQNVTYTTVPMQFITAENGVKYAYRRSGQKTEIPIIYFNHVRTYQK